MIYKPEFAEQAADLCDLGATDEELAEHFEVCVRTIYRWRNTHEAFAEAVVAGKEHADARVERALYSRAVGCSVQRTRVFKHVGDDKPVYATYTHHLPPDANAALQWLRTRQPKKWRTCEEEEADESWVEMLQKGLARVAEYEASNSTPPQQAATPQPPSEQEPPSESAPRPGPPPDPIPAPRPEPERDPEQPPASSAERERPSPIWDPKPMMGPSRWHYENSKNRPP